MSLYTKNLHKEITMAGIIPDISDIILSYTVKITNWKYIKTLLHDSDVISLDKLHDGSLVVGQYNGNISIWKDDKIIINFTHNSTTWLNCLVVLPDDSLALGYYDGIIRIWNDEKYTQIIRAGTNGILTLLYSNNLLISGNTTGDILVWRNGLCINILKGHTSGITALKILPNNNLVSSSWDMTIRIWDAWKCAPICRTTRSYTIKPKFILKGHNDMIYCLAISSDGTLASGSIDGTIKIWKDNICINTLKDDASVFCLVILFDGTIVSAIRSRKLKIWRDNKCIQDIDVDFDIYSLRSLYSDELIVGCKGGLVKIYE